MFEVSSWKDFKRRKTGRVSLEFGTVRPPGSNFWVLAPAAGYWLFRTPFGKARSSEA
jgi:hypothetical protein